MRRVSRRVVTLLMAVPFFAASVILIFLGFQNGRQQRTFIPATGVITRIEEERHPGADNDREYHVFVKYKDAEGREYESELGEYSSGFSEGGTIALKYDPDDHSHVITAGGTPRMIMFSMGTIGILCSFGLVLSALRH